MLRRVAQLRLQGCRRCWDAAACAAGVLVMAGSLQAIQQKRCWWWCCCFHRMQLHREEQRAIEPQTTSTLLTCDASIATAAEPGAEASSAGSWLEHLHLAGGHAAVACWAGVQVTKWVFWYVSHRKQFGMMCCCDGWLKSLRVRSAGQAYSVMLKLYPCLLPDMQTNPTPPTPYLPPINTTRNRLAKEQQHTIIITTFCNVSPGPAQQPRHPQIQHTVQALLSECLNQETGP